MGILYSPFSYFVGCMLFYEAFINDFQKYFKRNLSCLISTHKYYWKDCIGLILLHTLFYYFLWVKKETFSLSCLILKDTYLYTKLVAVIEKIKFKNATRKSCKIKVRDSDMNVRALIHSNYSNIKSLLDGQYHFRVISLLEILMTLSTPIPFQL